MPINSDKPHLWKADVAQSIDFYNDWFLRFAPDTYRKQRVSRTNDPLINIALEKKQLAALKRWLLRHGYKQIENDDASNLDAMTPGTFTVPHALSAKKKKTPTNNPTTCVVKTMHAGEHDFPFFIEAKSTGNAASTNRWHKKEAKKFLQLKECYGENVQFILLLCGHFDPFYLGYQAAEGIDWVWEHRLDDLSVILDRGEKYRPSNKVAKLKIPLTYAGNSI